MSASPPLTRHLIGFVQEQAKPDLGVLILAGATLILALAVLVIRFTLQPLSEPGLWRRRPQRRARGLTEIVE